MLHIPYYYAQKRLKVIETYLIGSIQTWTNKFRHAAINHNKIFGPIGFDSSDTIDQAASICNKWSSRFNNYIKIPWKNQLPNLQKTSMKWCYEPGQCFASHSMCPEASKIDSQTQPLFHQKRTQSSHINISAKGKQTKERNPTSQGFSQQKKNEPRWKNLQFTYFQLYYAIWF